MGHTPDSRYIHLRFDSEVSCGIINEHYPFKFKNNLEPK